MTQTRIITRRLRDTSPNSVSSGAKPLTWLAPTLGALALLAGGPVTAATTLSASWDSKCGKGTCFNDHGLYAVTFSASAFSGPVDVSRLFLDRSILGTMSAQFFNLSFTLNGQQVGAWGNWNMGSVAGDELSFWGPDLMWNPADGDLVLVLQLLAPNGEKLGGGGGWSFGDAWGSGSSFWGSGVGQGAPRGDPPPPPPPPGAPPPTSTGHSDAPPPPPVGVGPVPEPSTWLLMIGGFGLAGAALRRRRLVAAG